MKMPQEERDNIIKNVVDACSDGAKRVLEIYEKLIHDKTGIEIKIEYKLSADIPNKLIDQIYNSGNYYGEIFDDVKNPVEEVKENMSNGKCNYL